MQRRDHVPSKWDSPPSSSGAQAENNAARRAVPRNLDLSSIRGMSDDEKAELSRYISICSLYTTHHSSEIDVASQSSVNPNADEYKRPNPFLLEFGQTPEKSVTRNPNMPISTRDGLIPPVSIDSEGALTSASLNLNADGLHQQIMLAGINALALNNPTLLAQLLLGQSNPLNMNPSAISNNLRMSTILGGNLTSSVPDGLGLMKYRAPDVSSYAFDRKSGYRFDPSTGLHYDANSGLFINLALNTFLRWDPLLNTYLRVDAPGLGVSLGGLPHPVGPPFPSIPSVFPCALQGSVQAPAGAMNLPSSSQDQFMNETWQRMRELAKDVICDTQVTQKPEETVETSYSKMLISDSYGGKHKERSRSSSSSTSGSSSDQSYSRDRDKRVSRSRSRSGSYRKKSGRKSRRKKSVSRDRSHSDGRSREFKRGASKTTRRSSSRSRSHSTGRRRSQSRGRSHNRGGRRSCSGRRNQGRGGRRSRSLSVAQETKYRSRSRGKRRSRCRSPDQRKIRNRSHSRGKRRSRSRSPDQRKRRNRSRSFTRVTKRSRSRDINRHPSPEERITLQSADRPSRWSRNHSLLLPSRSPIKRGSRSRSLSRGRKTAICEHQILGSTKPCYLDLPNCEEKSSLDMPSLRENARLEQEKADNPDPNCLMQPILEPDYPVESKNENDRQDDLGGLSEFDYLDKALGNGNESLIVDEYEEVLEYECPVGKSADSPKKPSTSRDPIVVDIGDVLGYLFPNDNQKHNVIIVAPIPLVGERNDNVLKSQIEHQDLRSTSVCHGSALGSPCHYMLLNFKTAEAASEWYDSQNGYIILSNSAGSRMKAYLHLTKHINWKCVFCYCVNFPMRDLCLKCYRAKDNGFSPVEISKKPTKWVGMIKLKSCYPTTESVIKSLPSLERFNIQNIKMIIVANGTCAGGLCCFEFQSDAEGIMLGKFLTRLKRAWVYLIVNEKPAGGSDSNKNTDIGKVSVGRMDIVSNDDPISKCTSENETDTADTLADGDKKMDYLGHLFAENEPTRTLLLAPIRFSKNPALLKSELTAFVTFFRTLLENDGLFFNNVTINVDRKVGAPCSYVLIVFPDAATADGWRAKHNGSITLLRSEGQYSEVYLHFSEGNWYCQKCKWRNFQFRTICHHCFNHKEENGSDLIESSVTTKWVVTPCLYKWSNWFSDDGCIVTEWKNFLSDFKLKIDVLRDPKCVEYPQGCLFETEGCEESLRLRKCLYRTGRFTIFAAGKSAFTKFIPLCSTGDVSTTKIDTPMDCIDPGANSSSKESKSSCLPEAQAQEIKPGIILSWWGRDWALYSELLNHLFLENPLTRVTESQTVFVGPVPADIKTQTLLKIITSKLQLNDMPFTTITKHSGVGFGAPCCYALVNFKTAQDAKAFVITFSDGFVLSYNPKEPITPMEYCAFKTHLYLCKPNWRCSNCSTSNFGMRSICWNCLRSNHGSSTVLTFTSTPTNCVCIRNFQRSSATLELLLGDFPSLKSRCSIKYLKEESGIPLGVCVLETIDLDEAQKLFADICGTKRRSDTCYGILNRK